MTAWGFVHWRNGNGKEGWAWRFHIRSTGWSVESSMWKTYKSAAGAMRSARRVAKKLGIELDLVVPNLNPEKLDDAKAG